MASSIDQQFIEYIVKSLVGNPDAVKIERRIDEKGVLLELTVDPEDLGRVIGKRGATAQSLRTLLRALGTKNDARYNLKIIDVGGPGGRTRPADDSTTDSHTPASDDAAVDEPADEQEEEAVTEETVTEETVEEDKPSDVVSRTRAELADLDDLDL
jgi:predicted RNA-binding protein YlqC (UPF0109 family)